MARMRFMNIEVDNLTMDEALAEIEELIVANKNAYVVTPNVDHIVQIERGGDLCEAYQNADLILTDGKPLIWISKWYGTPIKEKISGSDLFPLLCEMAAVKGYSMFFLGAAEGVAKKAAENLMKKYAIPTAAYEVFDNVDDALNYLDSCPIPTVIKADGLALGKGVTIAFTREEAKQAVIEAMQDHKFGKSGDSIVIEEYLEGPEVSVLAFTDGKVVKPMVSSMDHKRAKDNDEGLNTGGMGTVAPNPYYTEAMADLCMETIFLPTINAMNTEGRTFKGCLYFGLMLTNDGPKVIEYNCRFGDPETQVVLPLLESDLLTVMQATTNGTLSDTEVKIKNGSACCVIMASDGYPAAYEKGFEITIPDDIADDVVVAGAKLQDGKLLTSGGRVLGVIATDESLEAAIDQAYKKVDQITFDNAYYRHDIGQRALKAISN